ncbi:hypothetical protein LTR48_002455 [Friedmanniomyces endolithicus]|uniref:Uncharacterized protein n=1 Tax=Rachicladosporium monterosium TaxID=1507873 RepID=A0ABR0LG67_9PEZI|nr:hypothetical protein LTR48_002455 [Friedmanniomyces endolithicus]KAK5148287.1 hypothetical protein LTR32_000401 [Rachicladosporium monterosium]
MSYYDNDSSWSAPGRQPSWEQQPPPSRSGTASVASQQGEMKAFASQFEEIDRATDNLVRSGKMFPGQIPGMSSPAAPSRRESIPTASRGYEGYASSDPRMGGPPPRNQSASEYDGGRPGSAGLQGYYAGQRYPGGRQSEAEQMQQAKRRMAAARERELRNYHQEQQYNRISTSGVKTTDRAMSPTAMNEEGRRDLIARQHRALYGDHSDIYTGEGSSRPQSQDARAQTGAEGAVQMPPRDRAESTASPAANAPSAQQPYGLLNEAQNASRTSNSSPGAASPPLSQSQKGTAAGVVPIGTRPAQTASGAPSGGLNKRSTTPLTPSSLSYGFSSVDAKDERSTSAASNPAALDKGVGGLGGGWGGGSAVWGSGKGSLAVQPSVWG